MADPTPPTAALCPVCSLAIRQEGEHWVKGKHCPRLHAWKGIQSFLTERDCYRRGYEREKRERERLEGAMRFLKGGRSPSVYIDRALELGWKDEVKP